MKTVFLFFAMSLVAAVYAADLNFNKNMFMNLEQDKTGFGLNAENSPEVSELKVNPAKSDMQGEGRHQLERQAQDQNSNVGIVVRVKPDEFNEKQLESSLSSFNPPTDLNVVQIESEEEAKPNLAQSAVQLWIAGEITNDAKANFRSQNYTDAELAAHGQWQQNELDGLPTVYCKMETITTWVEVEECAPASGFGSCHYSPGDGDYTIYQDCECVRWYTWYTMYGESDSVCLEYAPKAICKKVSKAVKEEVEVCREGKPSVATDMEQEIMKVGIFAGESESCHNPLVNLDKCGVRATVRARYECGETGEIFPDYNACRPKCNSICKKYTKYDSPKLMALGIDFTAIAGVTDSEKRLAVGREFGVCQQIGSREGSCIQTNPLTGSCILRDGRHYDYCCYSSPVAMALSNAIKDQLGISRNNCSGIPLSRLEEVDFSDPKIMAVMEAQIGNLIDNSMLSDLQEKYTSQPNDTRPAEEMGSSINTELYNRRIPGL